MLIHYFGLENMLKFNENLIGHKTPRYRNVSSPRDMAVYLKTLINFKNKYPKEGNELMGYLKNTIYNDRLPKYLPQKASVAHKIGTQTAVVNDVGIIYDKHPFILTVMSKNVDEGQASEVIAQISKIVYYYEQK
jgi:beta-lactamase class A